MDFDPTIRHSFWAFLFGGSMYWINSNGLSQTMLQRYLSLKDVKTARRALVYYVIGVSIMILLCCYNGLLIYSTYHDCDPLQTKLAKAKDQLLPLFVMDILKDVPGFAGLFIAGVFSAALSSLSTGLNSMAAVILEDFFKSFSKRQLTEKETRIIMRVTVLIIGFLAVVLVYAVQHMGSVLQLSMSVLAACYGPMLGIFLMGMFLPFTNSKVRTNFLTHLPNSTIFLFY
jgi:Na+/proline symporter